MDKYFESNRIITLLTVIVGVGSLYYINLKRTGYNNNEIEEEEKIIIDEKTGKKKIKKIYRKKRKMSFTSSLMYEGSYPDHANMTDPIINVILYLDHPPKQAQLMQAIDELCQYEHFNSYPSPINKNKNENENLNYNNHIDKKSFWGDKYIWKKAIFDYTDMIFLKDVQNENELNEYVENIMTKGLINHEHFDDNNNEYKNIEGKKINKNSKYPLWELHLIVNHSKHKNLSGMGHSAVLFRIHHSIGDGISLFQVALNMFKDKSGKSIRNKVKPFSRREKHFGISFSFIGKVLKALKKCLTIGMSSYDTNIAFNSLKDNNNKILTKKQSLTKYSGKRKMILMPTIELSLIKAIKNAANCSVNDVMLALTGGLVRRYCEKKNDIILEKKNKNVQSRALIPVAFPRSNEEISDPTRILSNKWAFISASLGVNHENSINRIKNINKEMNQIKNSPEAPIMLWIQNHILAHLPNFIARMTAWDALTRHTMVFSNVPGPDFPVYFAGEELKGFQMVFPNIIPQVGIISYNGLIYMNMIVDPEIVEDPIELRETFITEIESMAKDLGIDIKKEKTKNIDHEEEKKNDLLKKKKSWKERAGRLEGDNGYEIGDIFRIIRNNIKN